MPHKDNLPVIFLAFANEIGQQETQGYLRELPKEVRHLREVLKQAERDGLCELVIRTNATSQDIFSVFQSAEYRDRIAIFHYGGHANDYQLMLESADGEAHAADAGGLAAFFGQQNGLELVFLNGCSTQNQARGLLDANVSAVIATSRAIEDAVATQFAGHFYTGLAGGATVQVAFNEAEGAIITDRGSDRANLYREIGTSVHKDIIADDNPWHLFVRSGSESTENWNLHDATDNPLLGLPPLPERDLPKRPYRQLSSFTRDDAEVFFGRGYQIRELYQLITDPSAAPIILYCGQSGVGKSSLLAAGLIPRLESRPEKPHVMRYFRRRRSKGLAVMFNEELGSAVGTPFLESWSALESESGNPVSVIIDQLEEVFTRPSKHNKTELDDFLQELIPLYQRRSSRPQGKLILSFRKEWALDVKRRLEELKLPHTIRYLEPLDKRGIIEAIEGPAKVERLKKHYDLTIEEGLAESMAVELLRDEDSSLAPTLQIRLSRMWDSAGTPPRFDAKLYADLENESYGLRKFLSRQIDKLKETHKSEVRSGLALDILRFHTTGRGTSEAQTREELEKEYSHMKDRLGTFVSRCEDLFLLTVSATTTTDGSSTSQTTQTRLAHDTIAPLVRERFDKSARPGQRALRTIENRADEWRDDRVGATLDEADLGIAEAGARGMRRWKKHERRMIDASRLAQSQREKKRRLRKIGWITASTVAIVAVLVALFLGVRARAEKNRVHAARVVSLAESQTDPLLSSLLILSLEDYGEPAHGVRVALETVQKNIPEDIMKEHGKAVTSLACNPHDKQVVTASEDTTAKIWDLEFPHEVKTLADHEGIVFGAAFNSFGDRIATWTDKKIRIWESSESSQPTIVGCHADDINSVAFRKDGQHLLSATYGGVVRIWDVRNKTSLDGLLVDDCGIEETDSNQYGKQLALLETGGAQVMSASYSPNGRFVVVALADGRAKIWSGKDYRELYSIGVHNNPVEYAVFSNNGRYMVTVAYDDKTLLWQLDPLQTATEQSGPVILADPVELLGHSAWITGVRFSPDDERILTISEDTTAMLWTVQDLLNTEATYAPATLSGHMEPVRSGKFSPDGTLVVTASDDQAVRVWNVDGLASGATLDESQLFIGHEEDVTDVLFCEDNVRMVSASHDRQVRLWDARGSTEPLLLTRQDSEAQDARFSPDGSYIAAAFKNHPAGVWQENEESGELVKLRELGTDKVKSIDFSPNSSIDDGVQKILTVQANPDNNKWSQVKEWRANSGDPKIVFEPESRLEKAVYSPDGTRFITTPSSRKGHAIIWNRELGGETPLLSHGDEEVRHAEFSQDSSRVITATGSKAIVGGLTGNEPIAEFDVIGNWLKMAVFSPDGKELATSSVDGQVRLFHASKPGKPKNYPPYRGAVNSVAFAPGGKYLLAASLNGEARIWNKDGSGETITLKADGEGMNSARFNPDGDRVVTASVDGSVRVWHYKWHDLLDYLDSSTRVCLSVQERMNFLTEEEELACQRHQDCMQREYGKPDNSGSCTSAP